MPKSDTVQRYYYHNFDDKKILNWHVRELLSYLEKLVEQEGKPVGQHLLRHWLSSAKQKKKGAWSFPEEGFECSLLIKKNNSTKKSLTALESKDAK